MNLLKKVFRDPSKCQMKPGEITVDGRVVSGTQGVRFKGTETKEYTLEQVLFYLLHRDQKYTTYMGLCKERGIGKIYYTDQKVIVDEIEGAQELSVAVRMDGNDFRYTGSRNYSYLSDVCKEKGRPRTNYMIVPSSVSSPVTLSNIAEFLESGRCRSGMDMSELEKTEVTMDGIGFTVRDSVEGFTSEDWKKVSGVFLDGSQWQLAEWKIADVGEVLNAVPAFYLMRAGSQRSVHLMGYSITEIAIRNDVVNRSDLRSIKERIKDYVKNR